MTPVATRDLQPIAEPSVLGVSFAGSLGDGQGGARR
jgi:hypothetical protein